jgi:hypothetical protein
MHDGYFADASIAHPFIKMIAQHLPGSNADVIADLGGGTGFILQELIKEGLTSNLISVNLDCSATQLDAMKQTGISCINSFISDFSRKDIAASGKQIFFIMRSVLHYFGKDGLIPVLLHIRNQARSGEMFIHQTACFENAVQARCVNFLYQEMGTAKWYPTISELSKNFENTNWQTIDTCLAPPLKLSSVALGRRYGLDSLTMMKIGKRLMNKYGDIENVFQMTAHGFMAHLHYRICVAKAA